MSMLMILALQGSVALTPGAGEPTAAPPRETRCCFAHPSFVGVCQVIPAEDETCIDILAYLNAPNTAGKAYCSSTRLRGGWKRVPCPPAQGNDTRLRGGSCSERQDEREVAAVPGPIARAGPAGRARGLHGTASCD